MKKPIAAAAIAATTLGGVAAGATILGPGPAGAQDEGDAVSESPFADHLSEVLQPLVDDGTITASQRDAVVEQLRSSRPDPGQFGFHRHPRAGQRLEMGADLAEILGIEPAEMVEALRDGESLADLAEANGVDPQELVDAIVAAIEERVDGALEADRLDEERAAEILENATERAEGVVSGDYPDRPGPRHHHHPHGHSFGPGPADDGVEPASA